MDSQSVSIFHLHLARPLQCYHVVQLVGVVTFRPPVFVVLELMELGSLKDYLERHKATVTDQVRHSNANSPNSSKAL